MGANCDLSGKTFGSVAAAGALNDFWVTRSSSAEGFHVTLDAKVMGNKKDQTLANSFHTGSMTNKVALWTGKAPVAPAAGWSTLSVTSSAKNTESLDCHPS